LGDGSVGCWGSNDHGQLGDATQLQRIVPVMVQGLPGAATALALGGGHSCALVGSALWCWGENESGEVGAAGAPSGVVTPSKVPDGVTAAAAGQSHTCAVRSDGVWCWGLNNRGQLGDGTLIKHEPEAINFPAKALAAGYAHTCALVDGGYYSCWGA